MTTSLLSPSVFSLVERFTMAMVGTGLAAVKVARIVLCAVKKALREMGREELSEAEVAQVLEHSREVYISTVRPARNSDRLSDISPPVANRDDEEAHEVGTASSSKPLARPPAGRWPDQEPTNLKGLTTTQAAKKLGVARGTLVKLLDEGKIPSCKVGTHRRVQATDLDQYMKEAYLRSGTYIEKLAKSARGDVLPD